MEVGNQWQSHRGPNLDISPLWFHPAIQPLGCPSHPEQISSWPLMPTSLGRFAPNQDPDLPLLGRFLHLSLAIPLKKIGFNKCTRKGYRCVFALEVGGLSSVGSVWQCRDDGCLPASFCLAKPDPGHSQFGRSLGRLRLLHVTLPGDKSLVANGMPTAGETWQLRTWHLASS